MQHHQRGSGGDRSVIEMMASFHCVHTIPPIHTKSRYHINVSLLLHITTASSHQYVSMAYDKIKISHHHISILYYITMTQSIIVSQSYITMKCHHITILYHCAKSPVAMSQYHFTTSSTVALLLNLDIEKLTTVLIHRQGKLGSGELVHVHHVMSQ